MKLILIRHGDTDYNVENRYCGVSDPSLNSLGRDRVKKLIPALSDFQIDKVYTSDLRRAHETAALILDGVDSEKRIEFESSALFRELDFGIFEGMRYEEIMQKHSRDYTAWINDPFEIAPPKGESFNMLKKRVKKGLDELRSSNSDQTIALVTHGGPIKAILSDVFNYSGDKFWEIDQPRASHFVIDF